MSHVFNLSAPCFQFFFPFLPSFTQLSTSSLEFFFPLKVSIWLLPLWDEDLFQPFRSPWIWSRISLEGWWWTFLSTRLFIPTSSFLLLTTYLAINVVASFKTWLQILKTSFIERWDPYLILNRGTPMPALTVEPAGSAAMWLPRLGHQRVQVSGNMCSWGSGLPWKKASPETVMLERLQIAFLVFSPSQDCLPRQSPSSSPRNEEALESS